MKKISWGQGIVLSFILFAIGTFVLLYISLNTKVELVTDNYYEKELQYQKHIEIVKNTQSLSESVTAIQTTDAVIIKFPAIAEFLTYSGEITFFRSSDLKQDFRIAVNIDSQYVQTIPFGSKPKGMWRIKMKWFANSNEYYFEQPLVIQ